MSDYSWRKRYPDFVNEINWRAVAANYESRGHGLAGILLRLHEVHGETASC